MKKTNWDVDQEDDQILVEKVKCPVYRAFLKALYKLENWEAWSDGCK